jgi:hypothetical protein
MTSSKISTVKQPNQKEALPVLFFQSCIKAVLCTELVLRQKECWYLSGKASLRGYLMLDLLDLLDH